MKFVFFLVIFVFIETLSFADYIRVSWKDNSPNETNTVAEDGFIVQRADGPPNLDGSNFSVLANQDGIGANQTEFIDTAVVAGNGVIYSYRVCAVKKKADGTILMSGWTNIATSVAYPGSPPPPPPPPLETGAPADPSHAKAGP